MTISKFVCGIVSLVASVCAMAANEVCKEDYGVLHCTEGRIDSITHLGKTHLSGTQVTGLLKVLGNLEASHAVLGAMTITGNTEADSMTVHGSAEAIGNLRTGRSTYQSTLKLIGDLKGGSNVFAGPVNVIGMANLNHDELKQGLDITGKLSAEASTFTGPIQISACEAMFYQSGAQDLTVNAQLNCPLNLQKIYLRDQSQIKGNILFKGGNGRVYVEKDSAMLGRVIGGTIIRE